MTNQKHTTLGTPQQDRLSYLWLALGILLFAFVTVKWTIPLAAWLYPVFLLRFVRTQPLLRGMLLLLLAGVLVSVFVLQEVIPFQGAFYYLTVFSIAVVGFLPPYLLDRVLARRLGGLLGTLVFPLAVTTVSYLNALVGPFGTFGNLAYTQYGNLPLMQLVSVTGIWGIDFLMSWLASLVNWAWERGFAWPRVRGGAALYASLLALVLLFGGARLALFPAQGSTVRVAGITPSQALLAAANKQDSQNIEALMSGTETQADRELIRQASAPVYDELLALSLQEARAGAKIIVWPEASGDVTLLQEDEPALLSRASALARTTGTYLDLGLGVLLQHPVQSSFFTDEIILIDPTGSVVWRYEKAHPVPGEPFPPGDGLVPTVQTPYGRLSNVICFDADFPGTMRQAGQAGADLMLVPSNDWREVDPYHTQLITFRAIENGYSLVRQTSRGLAMTVDYEGNVLGASDFFTSDPQVIVAYVPMQGVHTIYATISDLFAWLSIAGLVVLIGVAIARRPKAVETGAAEPGGEPVVVS
jgi:apolipoprotein N-acyltransferase